MIVFEIGAAIVAIALAIGIVVGELDRERPAADSVLQQRPKVPGARWLGSVAATRG